MPRAVLCAALAVACSHGVRQDATPDLAALAPEAAAREAGQTDGPALTQAEMVEHILSRATFGPTREDRARVREAGISAWLEEQLHPEQIEDGVLEARLVSLPALQKPSGELVQELLSERKMRQREMRDDEMIANAPPPPAGEKAPQELRKPLGKAGSGPGFETVSQLSQAKILRAVASKRQLQEELVDFWFNHFNVFAGKETESALLPRYENAVVRPNALGTFAQLLEATAHSPAMLIYLDNWRSSAPAPRWLKKNNGPKRGLNENYARELLELHTLGVDGGYTQKDIVEVARCFTGWTVDEPQTDPHFVFRKGLHDFGEKRVLGHVIPAGHGVEDGERVLKILEEHPSTARFIAKKLARRFVSDDPPGTLVARVAETYTRTHGDIRSMLRTIFESPEFWSRKALKAKVRSPLELVAAAVRGLDATVDDPMALARAVARIGEPLYAAQPPTGYPDSAQTWLSSGALLARIDFGLQLANGKLEGVKVDLSPLGDGPPEEVLEKAALALGATELSETTRDSILKDAKAAPRVVGLLLGAPEIQRR